MEEKEKITIECSDAETEKATESGKHAKHEKSGGKSRKVITAIVIILLLLLIGLLAWKVFGPAPSAAVQLENSVRAELGQLEDKSNDEIEAELNRVVEEGSMAISINMAPMFANGTSDGDLKIENSPANIYGQEVVITILETGEEIYRSGLLLPNYHIQNDKLSVDLDAGVYDCMATFTAYNLDTMVEVGQASAAIQITVLG